MKCRNRSLSDLSITDVGCLGNRLSRVSTVVRIYCHWNRLAGDLLLPKFTINEIYYQWNLLSPKYNYRCNTEIDHYRIRLSPKSIVLEIDYHGYRLSLESTVTEIGWHGDLLLPKSTITEIYYQWNLLSPKYGNRCNIEIDHYRIRLSPMSVTPGIDCHWKSIIMDIEYRWNLLSRKSTVTEIGWHGNLLLPKFTINEVCYHQNMVTGIVSNTIKNIEISINIISVLCRTCKPIFIYLSLWAIGIQNSRLYRVSNQRQWSKSWGT